MGVPVGYAMIVEKKNCTSVEKKVLLGLHCNADESAAQCIVIAPVCLCVCLWVCYHDNSKLRASIFTKLGL